MADSTSANESPEMIMHDESDLCRHNLLIVLSDQARSDLGTLASLDDTTVAEVIEYLELIFKDQVTALADGMAAALADLVELSKGSDLATVLPRLRLVIESMNEIKRFAEGPFSDPRIEDFGPIRPPRSNRLAPDHHADLPHYTGNCVDGRPIVRTAEQPSPYEK